MIVLHENKAELHRTGVIKLELIAWFMIGKHIHYGRPI